MPEGTVVVGATSQCGEFDDVGRSTTWAIFCRMRSVPTTAASLSHTAAPGPKARNVCSGTDAVVTGNLVTVLGEMNSQCGGVGQVGHRVQCGAFLGEHLHRATDRRAVHAGIDLGDEVRAAVRVRRHSGRYSPWRPIDAQHDESATTCRAGG
jgi:hypothetical protein